jgi:H+-transporting ATPase
MLTGESLPIEAGPGVDTYAGALVRRGEATAEVTATGFTPNLAVRLNLCALRTLQVHSRRLYCESCGTWRFSMVSSSFLSERMPIFMRCRGARSSHCCSRRFWLQYPWHCRQHSPWRRRLELDLWQSWASCQLGYRLWMKLRQLMSCARTKRERSLAINFQSPASSRCPALTKPTFSAWQPSQALTAVMTLWMRRFALPPSQKPASDLPKLITFVPFDPAKKTSEATATDAKGGVVRIVKGAFTAVVASLTAPPPTAAGLADELEKQGFRVLAVAAALRASLKLLGLIALSDPPRKDSISLISELKTLGVRTVMVTGDAPATAASLPTQ